MPQTTKQLYMYIALAVTSAVLAGVLSWQLHAKSKATAHETDQPTVFISASNSQITTNSDFPADFGAPSSSMVDPPFDDLGPTNFDSPFDDLSPSTAFDTPFDDLGSAGDFSDGDMSFSFDGPFDSPFDDLGSPGVSTSDASIEEVAVPVSLTFPDSTTNSGERIREIRLPNRPVTLTIRENRTGQVKSVCINAQSGAHLDLSVRLNNGRLEVFNDGQPVPTI